MAWRIEFDGEVYREGDLTVGQCEQIEDLLAGKSWMVIHPIRSAAEASAVLAVCIATRTGADVGGVREKIRAMRADEYIARIQVVEDDLPTEFVDGNPPQADEPSTDT